MRIALALLLALTACGDDAPFLAPDGNTEPTPDAMADAPPEQVTLTTYVIELITNGTSNTAAARPYSEFGALPDPDLANPAAYQTLF